MAWNPAYNDGTRDLTLDVRERTGGPREPRGSRKHQQRSTDFYNRFASNSASGSHMPLDLDLHWDWANPLNVIPAFVILLFVIATVAFVVG